MKYILIATTVVLCAVPSAEANVPLRQPIELNPVTEAPVFVPDAKVRADLDKLRKYLDENKPQPAAPIIMHMVLPEPPKPTLKQRIAAAPKKAWSATKAGAKKVGRGAKKVGKKIHDLNDKAKPTVDVINTGTAIGGALFFWSKLFMKGG